MICLWFSFFFLRSSVWAFIFPRQKSQCGISLISTNMLTEKLSIWQFCYISFETRDCIKFKLKESYLIHHCCSVAQSCLTLQPYGLYSTQGFPVLHHHLELAQTHVHWVGDAIQQSCPLSSPSPTAFNLSQHQGLFQWVSSSHQVATVWSLAWTSVLTMNIQDWSPLGWTGWISLLSKGLSRVFSNTTVQKHQFFGAQLSL